MWAETIWDWNQELILDRDEKLVAEVYILKLSLKKTITLAIDKTTIGKNTHVKKESWKIPEKPVVMTLKRTIVSKDEYI